MTELLQLDFFRYALIGIILIAVASAVTGTYIVARRLVALCGGVTHACFGGLGLGYFLGINPIAVASFFAVGSALGVQWMSARRRVREDSAIAVFWAAGMAVGVTFVFLTPGYVPELNAFLFGNILTVGISDIILFAIFTSALILYMALRFRMVVACAFDPDFAYVAGLPVRRVNTLMTIFTALCIVLTIKMAGIMLLMSMLSIPQLTAELFCRRYGPIMMLSCVVSLVCCIGGLFLGAMVNVPCSALIVILMVAVYAFAAAIHTIKTRIGTF